MSTTKRKKDSVSDRDQRLLHLFIQKYLNAAILAAAKSKESYRASPTTPGFFERAEYWRHAVGYAEWLSSHVGGKLEGYDDFTVSWPL